MKFTVSRTLILDALRKVVPVTGGRNVMPILSNVKFDAADGKVTFTATDLDLTVMTTIPCNVIEGGSSTLPAKLLMDAVSKAADGDISIEVNTETSKATVKAGGSTFRIAGLPATDFPVLADDEECKSEFVIPQDIMKDIFRRTIYAMSQDDTRRTLKGVNLEFKEGKLLAVATDGRRLAYAEYTPETPYTLDVSITVPEKTVTEIFRHLGTTGNAEFYLRKTLLFVKLNDTLTLATKLIDDHYPNWRQVVPQANDKEIVVDRQMLISAIERVSVFTQESSVKFEFGDNLVTLSSATADLGEAKDEVPIKYNEDKIETRLNPFYVLGFLKSSDDDEVTFKFNDGNSPVIAKDSKPGLAVIMPLRFQ